MNLYSYYHEELDKAFYVVEYDRTEAAISFAAHIQGHYPAIDVRVPIRDIIVTATPQLVVEDRDL